MRLRSQLLRVLPVSIVVAQLGADEPTKIPPSRVVGSVLGKPVTAAEIELTEPIDTTVVFDSRDKARWKLMTKISTILGGPIIDRFIMQQKQKIEPTPEELTKAAADTREGRERTVRQMEAKLADLKAQLAKPQLAADQKAKLLKEQEEHETRLKIMREGLTLTSPTDFIRQLIIARKLERTLHETYGGRVIFQQFGPEALDARRKLFEQAEKDGDLTFDDAGVRRMFYYYSNMQHTYIDENALKGQ
jgi:hypothetical protein